jgi:hypothetical protein
VAEAALALTHLAVRPAEALPPHDHPADPAAAAVPAAVAAGRAVAVAADHAAAAVARAAVAAADDADL